MKSIINFFKAAVSVFSEVKTLQSQMRKKYPYFVE